MWIELLQGKLHRIRVTDCDLNYEGSLGVDRDLIEQAGMLPNQVVQVFNITTGNRFSTYLIPKPHGSKACQVNGAAARLCAVGDRLIVLTTVHLTTEEAAAHRPTVLLMNDANEVESSHH